MSVLSEVKIKATRKDHICDGCNKTIPKGSGAAKIAGYWDDFVSSYMCPDCHYLWSNREWFQKMFDGDEWEFGDFLTAANESGFDTTAELVQHLKSQKEI